MAVGRPVVAADFPAVAAALAAEVAAAHGDSSSLINQKHGVTCTCALSLLMGSC